MGDRAGSYLVSGRKRPIEFLDVAELGLAVAMPVMFVLYYQGWHLPLFMCILHVQRASYGGDTQYDGRPGDFIYMVLDLGLAGLQYVLWGGYIHRPILDVIDDPNRTREYVKMAMLGTMFLVSACRVLGVGNWFQPGGQLDYIRRARPSHKTMNDDQYPSSRPQQQQMMQPQQPQVVYVQAPSPMTAYPPVPPYVRSPYYPGYPQ